MRNLNSTTNARPNESSPEPYRALGTVFSLNPKRFAFASLVEPLLVAGEPVSDVFIPPALTADLLAGDTVELEARADGTGRLAATRLRVTERTRVLLVGLLSVSAKGTFFVDPEQTLAAKGLLVPRRLLPQGARAGTGVVVAVDRLELGRPEIAAVVAGPLDVATPAFAAVAAFVEGYGTAPAAEGPRDEAIAAAIAILRSRESGSALPRPLSDPKGLVRRDLRDCPTITIDGPSTRDIDDAISAAPLGEAIKVTVSIADAARLVPMGSALDRAAYLKGTSIYQATQTLPMLPRRLSEAAGSLLPNAERHALSVSFEVGPAGEVGAVDVFASLVRSDARLTYESVQASCYSAAAPRRPESLGRAAWETLQGACEAARRLGIARGERSTLGLGFVTPSREPRIVDGKLEIVAVQPYPDAESLIERLMVAANEAVGAWLCSRGVPALYRVHAGPDEEAWLRAGALLASAGLEHPLDASPASWNALLDQSGEHAPTLAAILAAGLAKAGYVPEPGHHFGLDSIPYLHFTSPLRRYADLVVHRVIRAVLAGEDPPYNATTLAEIGAWLDDRAAAAGRAEAAEIRRLWALALSGDDSLALGPAQVSRVGRAGLGLRFVEAGLVAKLPAERGRPWEVDAHRIVGRLGTDEVRVGDRLAAEVAAVDLLAGRVEAVRTPAA